MTRPHSDANISPISYPTKKRNSRHDPGRRDRIIDAAVRVLSRVGVDGASHRTIAQEAGVPLGSMTYHFNGLDEILAEAFSRFTEGATQGFEEPFEGVTSLEGARAAIVSSLVDASDPEGDLIVLSSELYAAGIRHPRFGAILEAWIRRCRAVMARYFDQSTVYILDAFYQGIILHRALNSVQHPVELIELAVERMTPPHTFIYHG